MTRGQVDAAYTLLRDSLDKPRYTYIDFLNDNNPKVKTKNEISIKGDTLSGDNETFAYHVNTPEEGLYYFTLNYKTASNGFTDVTVSLQVNGETQYSDANNIILPVFWEDESKIYPVDKYGDESTPLQRQIPGPHTVSLFDTRYTTDRPLYFLLNQGDNLIEIRNETSQTLWLGDLTAYPYREPIPYKAPGTDAIPEYININAVDYVKKNSPHVSINSYSSPHVAPYDPLNKKISTIRSRRAGNEVFYQFYAHQDGNYAITLHYQTAIEDFSSFISVKIDGDFPFAQAASYPLAPSVNVWRNQTLTDAEGKPFLAPLSRGNHVFSIKTEVSPVSRQERSLRLLVDHLNQFAIEIRKVTGKDIDRNRTWRLTQYIPEVKDYLDAYDIIFRDIIHGLSQYSPKGADSSVIAPMVQALSYLEKLRKKPDELPLYIESLSGQDASVLQQAGVALNSLYALGVEIDAIYIGSAAGLPKEKARITTVLADGLRKLWHSYTSDKYIVRNQSDALNIWYASSYMQADLLQKLIDTRFTPQSGIKVNVSIMPDVNKLIMARAARTNPDMALGLGSWIPFDLAVRGALYDFTQFDDFWEFAGNFIPGSLTSYVLNEKVYGVPETITFNAVVYREDILGQLNIAPPDTWTDVAEMMAELQRFNMSFYMPIASGVGYKWYYQTSPLIYQNNGSLYRSDGLGAAINEASAVKALTFLGDLFTTYAVAEQVPEFFNSFRLGQTPVGIIEPGAYILLSNSAPELLGQWSLSPYPGTPQEDGSISRWFITNGAGGSIIFENTNQADNCWKFLKWYLSEETQTNYAFSLYTNYRILHLSSNLKALRNLPIEDKDLRVILESVLWLRDVPRSPGQYLLERGLSDIWNTIVFDGTPAQVAIDRQVIEIQREFKKKMTEFGYLNSTGEQVRPYVVHEVDWIIEQIEKAGR
ncbi:MAG: extracellular solute-binding protein [Treponema sp.]|nr:extracellular solute-binding protein [Treponema sp.]